MNADLDRLYIWAAEKAIVIGFLGFCAVAVLMGMECNNTFFTRVTRLTINSRFAWDDQINIVCLRVYFTLKDL
jgi:hypothetical protein